MLFSLLFVVQGGGLSSAWAGADCSAWMSNEFSGSIDPLSHDDMFESSLDSSSENMYHGTKLWNLPGILTDRYIFTTGGSFGEENGHQHGAVVNATTQLSNAFNYGCGSLDEATLPLLRFIFFCILYFILYFIFYIL